MDLAELQAHAESRGLSREDAAAFAEVVLEQAHQLTNNAGGTVTREQLAQAMYQTAANEVLQDEMSISRWNNDNFKRAMEDIILADGEADDEYEEDDDEDEDDEQDDGSNAVALPFDPLSQPPPQSSQFTDPGLEAYYSGKDLTDVNADLHTLGTLSLKHGGRDLVTSLCMHVELAVELGKHLRPGDILNLYIANRAFNNAVSGHLLSCIRMWIAYSAPDAGEVFKFNFYRRLLVHDPAGRTWEEQYDENQTDMPPERLRDVRVIPGLKYLQLVLGRNRYCSEITAILARSGHRTPATMHGTLLRLWQLMEISSTPQRQAWLRQKEIWTDYHLYNCQLFFIKLGMHFNDPIYGPQTLELMQLMLGQKGLFPLWQLLMRKRFTRLSELLEAHARYNMRVPERRQATVTPATVLHGVPIDQVGRGHLEGWGVGQNHLMRPDELIPVEAVARGLELERHLPHMVTWGYFDQMTGDNLVPTEEEMYISDDERVLAHMDTTQHWKPKHVLKGRWDELTQAQRLEIQRQDEDDLLRAQAWCTPEIDEDDEGEYSSDGGYTDDKDHRYHPEDEITRGYIVPPQPKPKRGQTTVVPPMEDRENWNLYMSRMRIGLPPVLSRDEAARTLPQRIESDERYTGDFNWSQWLKEKQAEAGEDEDSESESLGGTDVPGNPIINHPLSPEYDEEISEISEDGSEMSEEDSDQNDSDVSENDGEEEHSLTRSEIENIEEDEEIDASDVEPEAMEVDEDAEGSEVENAAGLDEHEASMMKILIHDY